jgi:hypothetical protein
MAKVEWLSGTRPAKEFPTYSLAHWWAYLWNRTVGPLVADIAVAVAEWGDGDDDTGDAGGSRSRDLDL